MYKAKVYIFTAKNKIKIEPKKKKRNEIEKRKFPKPFDVSRSCIKYKWSMMRYKSCSVTGLGY